MAGKKILVIEDDLFFQTYVNDLLSETDFDIITASDGEKGLALARSELPDIVLTDIEIPKVQGFVLLRNLKESQDTAHIPVIMMSGKVERDLLKKHAQLRVHADGYLLKPFSGQELFDMLSKVLGRLDQAEPLLDRESIEDKLQGLVDISSAADTDLEIELAEEMADNVAPPAAKDQLSVLAVDDSGYILDMVREFLEEAGMRVYQAMDGEEGLEVAREILPDLVLLDVQMPAMNGFIVCENLKKDPNTSWIPVVIMSAVVDEDSLRRYSGLKHRADGYLRKPFKKAELLDVVRRIAGAGGAGTATKVISDVEEKTDFLLPVAEVQDQQQALTAAERKKLSEATEQLKTARLEIEGLQKKQSDLMDELSSVQRHKDEILTKLENLEEQATDRERELSEKLTLATKRVDETGKSLDDLQGVDGKLKMDLAAAVSAKEEVEEQARALVENHQQERDRIKKLQGDLDALEKKRIELEGDITGRDEKLLGLEKEKENLQLKLSDLSTEFVRLDTENQELKSQVTEGSVRVSELERHSRELEESVPDPEEIASREAELTSVRDDLSLGRERIRILEEERDKLAEDKSAARQEISSAEEAARKTAGELESLRKVVSERESSIESLESELESQRKILTDQAETRLELEEKVRELEETLAEAEAEAGKLSAVESDLELEKAARAELAEKTAGELEAKQKILDETGEVRDEMSRQVELGESRIHELEKELAAGNERITSLETVEEELSAATERLRGLEALEGELEKEREKVSRLQESEEEIKAERERIKDIEGRYEKLLEENSYLHTRLEEGSSVEAESLSGWVESMKTGSTGSEFDLIQKEFSDRLDKLEGILDRTVSEAQSVVLEQKEQEDRLEDRLRSMMQALEDERDEHRKERERRRVTEDEMRKLVEESYQERMKMMGEEMERFYPMQVKDVPRPLEVVTGRRRMTTIAILVLLACLVFFAGYLTLSSLKDGKGAGRTTLEQTPAGEGSSDLSDASAVHDPDDESGYEELWRRQTVQSVSEDMRIQATLHTREELISAIKFSAAREKWSEDRISRVIGDLSNTFSLNRSFYVTVFAKNLKSGYPGYANNLESHLVLRDPEGNETGALLTEGLANRKFIMSHITAAGKHVNPVFMYEVGITVAFPKEKIVVSPEKLQLVIYDVGEVPLRVLSWDVSDWKVAI